MTYKVGQLSYTYTWAIKKLNWGLNNKKIYNRITRYHPKNYTNFLQSQRKPVSYLQQPERIAPYKTYFYHALMNKSLCTRRGRLWNGVLTQAWPILWNYFMLLQSPFKKIKFSLLGFHVFFTFFKLQRNQNLLQWDTTETVSGNKSMIYSCAKLSHLKCINEYE